MDFQILINKFGETYSKETVSKVKNHISQCLRDAYADGVIRRDPTIRITLSGNDGKSSELKFLEYDDFLKLDHYVVQHLNKQAYLTIYIAIHTGCRYSEVVALTSNDLDVKNHTLLINKAAKC